MTKEIKQEAKPEEPPKVKPEEPKPLTPVEEAKKTVAELNKATAESKEERIKLEAVRSEEILAGTAEAGKAPAKPETEQEYFDRFHKGEVDPFKDDGVK